VHNIEGQITKEPGPSEAYKSMFPFPHLYRAKYSSKLLIQSFNDSPIANYNYFNISPAWILFIPNPLGHGDKIHFSPDIGSQAPEALHEF